MKSQAMHEMLNDTYANARAARDFAESLTDANDIKAQRFWHQLADHLYAAVEHADEYAIANAISPRSFL
mgnify:CR=1 FL=1